MYEESHWPEYHNRVDLFEAEMQPWDYHQVLFDLHVLVQSLDEAD